jgi:hypothetical protein
MIVDFRSVFIYRFNRLNNSRLMHNRVDKMTAI